MSQQAVSVQNNQGFWKKIELFVVSKPLHRELLFLATLSATLFLLIALLSFHPFDASYFSVSVPAQETANVAGTIGANISAAMIHWFGIAAFILPLLLITNTFLVVFKDAKVLRPAYLLSSLCLYLAAAYFLALAFDKMTFQKVTLSTGGTLGLWLKTVMHRYAGNYGSILLFTLVSIGSVSVLLEQTLSLNLMRKIWHRQLPLNMKFMKLSFLKMPSLKFLSLKKAMNSDHRLTAVSDKGTGIDSVIDSGIEHGVANDEDIVENSIIDKAQDNEIDPIEIASAPIIRGDTASLTQQKKLNPAIKGYKFLSLALFQKSQPIPKSDYKKFEQLGENIRKVLADFAVDGKMVGYQPGPVVTVYEFEPAVGIKQSKILGLIDDLALALKVDSIFIHPVKDKRAMGIQVPNPVREMVMLGDLFDNEEFINSKQPLKVAMGKAISGDPVYADLTGMPHLLMAGATGAGKSMAINSSIANVLYRSSPDHVRMILVDPKMLELSVYEGIPHLLMPVITEPQRAAAALKWAVNEMERRYKIMQHMSVRNIEGFNEAWAKASENERKLLKEKMNDNEIDQMPFILLVIDELADLMMTAPKEVEGIIQRLAQKARASGIHMILATQRPSVDVITGVIKANLPCRIAFQVVSKHDSRTILDQQGAEKLLGKGDMLFMKPGAMRLERIQGPFVSDKEVKDLVEGIKKQYQSSYDDKIVSWVEDEMSRQDSGDLGAGNMALDGDEDERYGAAVEIAQQQGAISASYLQRQLKIGYNRAARIVETMEQQGLIAKADGVKPRKWLGYQTKSI